MGIAMGFLLPHVTHWRSLILRRRESGGQIGGLKNPKRSLKRETEYRSQCHIEDSTYAKVFYICAHPWDRKPCASYPYPLDWGFDFVGD
jgi:hypothetical protein